MKVILNLLVAAVLVVGLAGCATTSPRETSMGNGTNKPVCLACNYEHAPFAIGP